MKRLGGTPYVIILQPDAPRLISLIFSLVHKASKPRKAFLEKIEAAYSLLYGQDGRRFGAALVSGEIEKDVWLFIANTDPWFRPRKFVPGMVGHREEDGKIVEVVYETEEQLYAASGGNAIV